MIVMILYQKLVTDLLAMGLECTLLSVDLLVLWRFGTQTLVAFSGTTDFRSATGGFCSQLPTLQCTRNFCWP